MTHARFAPLALTLLLALGAALACGGEREPDAQTTPAAQPAARADASAAQPDAAAQARDLFELRCVTCHGPQGAGDGPGSAGLTPKPRDFRDPAWQESVTDTHLTQIILYGGAAVGRSPTMPGNPDLNEKPAVVEELVKLIRAMPAG